MVLQEAPMLNFRTAYLQAMREQAPAMFNELRRSGAMETHLNRKAAEAQAMFRELTEGKPTLPSGALANPQDAQQATEQVFATLITFPPPNSAPEADPARPAGPPIP